MNIRFIAKQLALLVAVLGGAMAIVAAWGGVQAGLGSEGEATASLVDQGKTRGRLKQPPYSNPGYFLRVREQAKELGPPMRYHQPPPAPVDPYAAGPLNDRVPGVVLPGQRYAAEQQPAGPAANPLAAAFGAGQQPHRPRKGRHLAERRAAT